MGAIFYNHLGLGDHLIHSSAIRKLNFLNNYDEICIIIKERDVNTLKQLYSDLNNVKFIYVQTHGEALNIVNNYSGEKFSCWWYGKNLDEENQYEDIAYISLGLNPIDRYEWFKINRDINREDIVFNDIIKTEEKYIFVTDDENRGYKFNDDLILKDRKIRIIRSNDYLNYTPLELFKVIENSEEIHCMYSSFFFLCDQYSGIEFKLPKIVLHETYINKIGVSDINNLPYEYKNLLKVLNKRKIEII